MTGEDQLRAVGRLLGGADPRALAEETGVPIGALTWWEKRARSVLGNAFRSRRAGSSMDGAGGLEARLREYAQEIELLRARFYSKRPFAAEEIRAVSRIISPSTGQPYGVQRVFRVWRIPRSSFYESIASDRPSTRRGRPPGVPDEALEAAARRLFGSHQTSLRPSAAQARAMLVESLGAPVALKRVRCVLRRLTA